MRRLAVVGVEGGLFCKIDRLKPVEERRLSDPTTPRLLAAFSVTAIAIYRIKKLASPSRCE